MKKLLVLLSAAVAVGSGAAFGDSVQFTLTGYTGWVDGLGHGVTVNVTTPESGYAIQYSLNSPDDFSDVAPLITEAGSNEVFVCVSADGYESVTKSAVVWLANDSGEPLRFIAETPGYYSFAPAGAAMADILVVGGGGSGGTKNGGGGGGGYVLYKRGVLMQGGATYSIYVGAGGAAKTGANRGDAGENSYLKCATLSFDLTAPGGGYGGGGWSTIDGGKGGNGGGAGGNASMPRPIMVGGASNAGDFGLPAGHKGGDVDIGYKGAGGGGMGGDGLNRIEQTEPKELTPNGGPGVTNDITGVEVVYGAGGGGYPSGLGGAGDGSGDSAKSGSVNASAGIDGTGGGGGGGNGCDNGITSGAGGCGSVIIRYRYLSSVPPALSGDLFGETFENDTIVIEGRVDYLGDGADSCKVEVLTGTDPAALVPHEILTVTELYTPFKYVESTTPDSVYYWQVRLTSSTGDVATSPLTRLRSYGKWHYENGIVDNGMWNFNATDDGNGNVTVGTCVKYPRTARILDFGRAVVNEADSSSCVLVKLDPKFSTATSPGNNRSKATPSVYVLSLGELVLPSVGLTTIGDFAFARCTALTNVVNFLPDSVTTLGLSVFTYDANVVEDLSLMGVGTVRENAFSYSGVTSVRFGPDLKILSGWNSDGCFQGCSGLTNVAFDAEMSGAQFNGEHSHFNGCSKLEGTLDLRGFTVLNAYSGNGPFPGTKYGKFLVGDGEGMTLSSTFFNNSSVTSIVFEGVPPTSLGVPYLGTLTSKKVATYIYRKNKAKPNSKGKCWLDYATDRVINGKTSTWAQDGTIITVDSSLRPLLTVEPDGLMLIVK